MNRFAAASRRRHALAVARADALADAAEAAVRRLWRAALALLKKPPAPHRLAGEARALFARLAADPARAVGSGLYGLADWSYRRAARELPVRVAESLSAPDVFDPPPEDVVARIIYATDWVRRLTDATRLGDPGALANVLLAGIAQGKDQKGIAKDLLPHVENVRSTARRVARTEGIRVANRLAFEAHEALGKDLVVGYTIHSAKSPYSRPWHRARSGTNYYRNPAAGQFGFDRMPLPPHESPDPRDRPAGAPAVAPNCLCYLVPVLAD